MTRYKIALIKGDGVGPDLIDSARTVLETINDHSKVKFTLIECEAGDYAKKELGSPLPEAEMQTVDSRDACLKGPVGECAAEVMIVLRRNLDLYPNIRPAKSDASVD